MRGYYGHDGYLPLYIFCGEHLLGARWRPSNIDAAAGSVEGVARRVAPIRQAWPEVKIIVRGDSGSCREELMAWWEGQKVDSATAPRVGQGRVSVLFPRTASECGNSDAELEAVPGPSGKTKITTRVEKRPVLTYHRVALPMPVLPFRLKTA